LAGSGLAAAERLPEQGVGHHGHRLAATQALAVKRADHVVGEPGEYRFRGMVF
jgi:hypothetical protein